MIAYRSPLSWRKIIILVVLIFAAVIFLSYEHILKGMGQFLVIEQEPEKADVIVVLNGRDTERSLAAVDLYEQGYANLIILARGPKQPGCDEFWKRVGTDWKSKVFFQRAIEAMGVPEGAFRLIGDGVTSTYDEAKVTQKILRENGYKSIILVTSKWHSKRAYLTFKSAFSDDHETKIIPYPSEYDNFDPDRWWKKEVDAEVVFGEYVRLIYYIITLRISPFV